MRDPTALIAFEWDQGNSEKSYRKHGITAKEAEEVFLDERSIVVEDIKHSGLEERSIIIGQTFSGKLLFVVFIIRSTHIRVISARVVNKKERGQYEQKNT